MFLYIKKKKIHPVKAKSSWYQYVIGNLGVGVSPLCLLHLWLIFSKLDLYYLENIMRLPITNTYVFQESRLENEKLEVNTFKEFLTMGL